MSERVPMKISQLADRFGSNRMNAAEPAKFLRGCSCVAVPFAGGLCEVPHFTANVILVNDLDRHVMNLAAVVRDDPRRLTELCDKTLFHPDELVKAQDICKRKRESESPCMEWAHAYYVASWMTRGGKMGSKGEFDQGMSVRWKSGGGDSVVRFRNSTEGITEWSEAVKPCTFTTLDCFEFLTQCKKRDIPENGIYADPPWPDDGANYTHSFTEPMHRKLTELLASFERSRIVVRFGDHPLIRELYPETVWAWNLLKSRTQANKEKAEVLLTRNTKE